MKKRVMVVMAIVAGACMAMLTGCGKPALGGGGRISSAYNHSDQYQMGRGSTEETITKLDLNWISGSVNLVKGSGKEITFSEEANQKLDEDTSMYYWIDGETLHIQYCREGEIFLSGNLQKDLTITVPEGCHLEECYVDTVSANVYGDSIIAQEFRIDTVSGTTELTACVAEDLVKVSSTSGSVNISLAEDTRDITIDTVSGNSTIQVPYMDDFTVDTTSGDVELVTDKAPEDVDADTISGKVTLDLPPELSAVISFDTISGEFHSDLPGRIDGDDYVFGNGRNSYEINTVSGDFAIVKR
ncbi:MAG: DUF4097 family beta strand repeat-containing protein [Lachnospiraceae bacterium]|nr:DUF4097 family beta strand repeat-containing protein [Lachnospiraceae bacterium]